MVVPYWKYTVVVSPCGSTDPLSVAVLVAIFVAAFVITTGRPVALSVVNVLSLPYLVPALFVATIRK